MARVFNVRGLQTFLAVVADGASSATHSSKGADLVCSVLTREVSAFLESGNGVSDLTEAQAQNWLAAVRSAIVERADGAQLSDFATTMLLAVVDESSAGFAQIGDGVIVTRERVDGNHGDGKKAGCGVPDEVVASNLASSGAMGRGSKVTNTEAVTPRHDPGPLLQHAYSSDAFGDRDAFQYELSDSIRVRPQNDNRCLKDPDRAAFRCVFWPDHGEFINTTTFVTDRLAHEKLKVSLLESSPVDVALLSDGLEQCALRFDILDAHQGFFESVFAPLRLAKGIGRIPDLAEELAVFLGSDRVNARSDDDKSLILATRDVAISTQPLPSSQS